MLNKDSKLSREVRRPNYRFTALWSMMVVVAFFLSISFGFAMAQREYDTVADSTPSGDVEKTCEVGADCWYTGSFDVIAGPLITQSVTTQDSRFTLGSATERVTIKSNGEFVVNGNTTLGDSRSDVHTINGDVVINGSIRVQQPATIPTEPGLHIGYHSYNGGRTQFRNVKIKDGRGTPFSTRPGWLRRQRE